MCSNETDKVKLAKLILKITGIDRNMASVVLQCEGAAYGNDDSYMKSDFVYYEQSGSIYFLQDEVFGMGPYSHIDADEVSACGRYFSNGFGSQAFFDLNGRGGLSIRFIMSINSAYNKNRIINLFVTAHFENWRKCNEYEISAYTHVIDDIEYEISPTLLWLTLNQ